MAARLNGRGAGAASARSRRAEVASARPLAVLLVVCACAGLASADTHAKRVIGATAAVELVDVALEFRARVDTGAASSSLHAERIQVASATDPKGKPISFVTANERGESRRISATVAAVVKVKTAEGSERRYKVPLTLRWKDVRKTVLVTLNDRSSLEHRMLLGRNWLRGEFLVDVSLDGDD